MKKYLSILISFLFVFSLFCVSSNIDKLSEKDDSSINKTVALANSANDVSEEDTSLATLESKPSKFTPDTSTEIKSDTDNQLPDGFKYCTYDISDLSYRDFDFSYEGLKAATNPEGLKVKTKYSNGPVLYELSDGGELLVDPNTKWTQVKFANDYELVYQSSSKYFEVKFGDGESIFGRYNVNTSYPDQFTYNLKSGEVIVVFKDYSVRYELDGGIYYYQVGTDGQLALNNAMNKIIFHYSNEEEEKLKNKFLKMLIERHPSAPLVKLIKLAQKKKIKLTEHKKLAILATNYYRDLSKIDNIKYNDLIEKAAKNHAYYVAVNQIPGHGETRGKKGFTGAHFSERFEYVGFKGNGGEVVAYNGNPLADIISWQYTLYHRLGVIGPVNMEIGYAASLTDKIEKGIDKYMNGGVMNYSIDVEKTVDPVFYPEDKQNEIPISWDGLENPSPLGRDPKTDIGYPITVFYGYKMLETRSGNTIYYTWVADKPAKTSITLYDNEEKEVPCYNNSNFVSYKNNEYTCVIPKEPLEFNKTYTAVYKENGEVAKKWSFTTTKVPYLIIPE